MVKIISEKTVLKGGLFEVKEQIFKLENGREKKHLNVYRNPTIAVLPLTDKYEVYLVSQYRYMVGKKTLEAMAGFVDPGEKPLDGAKRELQEETGLTAKNWQELAKVELAASVIKTNMYLYLARELTKSKATNPDDDENIEVIKMSLDNAVNKVINGEINHSSSMIGLLFLDKLRRENKL